MMERTGRVLLGASVVSVALVGAILTTHAKAQGGYQIGENGAAADAGPVRLARVSYVTGPVAWRSTANDDWAKAGTNLPLRQGAQVWVKGGSRSELQFDDGSTLRLGGGAVCSLPTMYSDDRGEFTEIKLNSGIATLHLRNKLSEYQVDTPLSSVKCYGPAEIRVGVGNTVEIACLAGQADVDGRQGDTVLHTRQRLDIVNPYDPYRVTSMPDPDQWDRFNENRDVIYTRHNLHVPSNIDLMAGDLDDYGDWHDDPSYGYVWAPRVHEVGWRPYHHGRWVWVSPWGWTWVGDEPWGWAPYHYGTWVDEPYGWAWCPGPAVQYWSPAVVDFVDYDPYVGWAPLAPGEVVYPAAINIGFHSGNWWLNFAIGGAAAYYPAGPSFCEARPWDNVFVNRQVNVYNVTNIYNNVGPDAGRYFVRNSPFVPRNAARFAGMTRVARNEFGQGGRFQAVAADPSGNFFRKGRSFGSAPRGWQVSGPPNIRPNRTAFSASGRFVRASGPPAALLSRNVVRDRLPSAIAGRRPAMTNMLRPGTGRAAVIGSANTSRISSKATLRRPGNANPGPVMRSGRNPFVQSHGRNGPQNMRVQHGPVPQRQFSRPMPQHVQRGGGHQSGPQRTFSRPMPQHVQRGGGHQAGPQHQYVRPSPQHVRGHGGGQNFTPRLQHQRSGPGGFGPQHARPQTASRDYSRPTRQFQPSRNYQPRRYVPHQASRPGRQAPPRQQGGHTGGSGGGGGGRGHGRHGG